MLWDKNRPTLKNVLIYVNDLKCWWSDHFFVICWVITTWIRNILSVEIIHFCLFLHISFSLSWLIFSGLMKNNVSIYRQLSEYSGRHVQCYQFSILPYSVREFVLNMWKAHIWMFEMDVVAMLVTVKRIYIIEKEGG